MSLSFLRALDTDLGSIMKAAQAFDWQRIPFVLEAQSVEQHVYMMSRL